MIGHDVLNDRQAKPDPETFGTEHGFKDPLHILFRNPGAVVSPLGCSIKRASRKSRLPGSFQRYWNAGAIRINKKIVAIKLQNRNKDK